MIFKRGCRNSFSINRSRGFNFLWFHGSEKLLFTAKLITKGERQNIKKIPHNILEKIKIGLNT